MSGNERPEDPGDKQQQRAERPKLPSIRSLFGISREDDLDTLLQNVDPPSRRSEERERRASRSPLEGSQAQPLVQPLRSPRSPRPPPSSFIAGDIRHSLAGPSDARAGRRSSGSPSDHAGPSRGAVGASTFSDPSPSPLSPPQTPISPESVRPERRSRVYSPAAAGRRPSSRASRPTSRAGRLSIEPHPESLASGSSQHISPVSPSTASPSIPRRSLVIDPTSYSPFEPLPSPVESSLRRRHTITDPPAEYSSAPSTSPTTSSRPSTGTQRRSLQSSFPSLPAPWADAPDRQLPLLPGPSRTESQHRPRSRQSRQSANPYPASSTVPPRPATSPSPYATHPPSSFPRRFAETSTSDSHSSSPYGTGAPPAASASSTSIPLAPRSAHDTLHPSLRRPWTADSAAGYMRRSDDAPASQPPPLGSTEPPRQGPAPTSTAGTARYECPYCQKRFNRPSSLKIHVNTHTGEKPFQCPFPGCGRRFSVMSNMRRHSRVHTQARPEDEVDPDAEGEPDAASETPTTTEHGSERPSLQPLQVSTSSSSGTGPSAASSSSRRASSSTSRRSRPPGTPSRARPASTHASGSGVQVSSPSRTPHRAIQPAPASSPSTSLDPAFLMPTVPEPLGFGAQRLYDESIGRPRSPTPPRSPPPPPMPPARVTRASLKRQLSDGSSNNDERSQKRSKPGDKS